MDRGRVAAAAASQADAVCRPQVERPHPQDLRARRARVGRRAARARGRRAARMSAGFLEFVDLASERFGGAAGAANDEFFAPKENLIKGAPAVWREGDYTERGKWMDGWETRRRRDDGDHDWCIVRLGARGGVRGVDVDTSFFRGNFPESCAIDAYDIRGLPAIDDLTHADWREIVPRRSLIADSHNR